MEREAGRILVADDNENNRDLLARRLARQGHSVAVAEDGRQALALLEAEPFDLVLLDILMPEMDGFETLRRIKESERLRHLPVVMISAVDDVESVVRCIELGAEDHLPKPFNPVLLRARVGASLERKRLRDREQLYARALQRELEIGREIQAGFLPEALPEVAGWEIAARFRPARLVAGDFYDAYPLPGGRLALTVADVCDKGVGAALFMALVRTLLRALTAEHFSDAAAGSDDAAERLRRAVTAVSDYVAVTHGRASMFATLFHAVLDVEGGSLTCVNAGHEPPFLLHPDGTVLRLLPGGPAVGLLPGLDFAAAEAALPPGALLLGFTDGVTEAPAADGTRFSEERLLDLLRDSPPSAEEALRRVEAAVEAHSGEREAFDDVTLLALRRLPAAG